jgi:nucleoside-diphosphate-sugar epimerase
VMVINTMGGGHASLGPHLAEKLLSQGHKVTVRQDGPENTSGPFARYAALQSAFPDAFALSYGAPDAEAIPPSVFDAIYDNCSKSPADAAAAMAAARAGAELFYVSSAGAYSYNPNLAPHISGDAASGPTIEVEDAMRSEGVSSAVFRPIYVIGPGNAKREYLDFFFDRITRGRPIPVPGHPSNFVSLTDARDVASMLAGALGQNFENAIFNSVSPRAVTVDGIAQMCASAASAAVPKLVAYDPKVVAESIEGFKVKKAFPFRPRHFFADPMLNAEAAAKLDWDPCFSGAAQALASVVAEAYAEYLAMDLDKRDVDFSLDDAILATL